jgi:hypothetical protein
VTTPPAPPPPTPAPRRRRRGLRLLVGLLVGLPLLALGGSGYYAARGPRLCGDCHEIQPSVALWQSSTHRGVGCDACHGGILTPQIEFHLGNLRRVGVHLAGKLPERIRITDQQVDALVERCVRCHQQEAAEWSAGPHGTTYRRIFLDASHNRRRLLMDDCLRCHGMYFEGPIRDLVAPLDTVGPWRLEPEGMGTRHAIPCMACHQIHREGMPLGMLPARAESAPGDRERFRPSLALYDRRGQRDVPADLLPLPAMRDHGRPVAASPDPRQALCYQCHAPQASAEVASGDDRTGIGVHEGISCLSCHSSHRQDTRASCAGCHPAFSNCGLDVEAMDTTFKSPKSPHDIHFVGCRDCHGDRVPPRRSRATVSG